jgi:small-conductance mechanosensitive channel
MNDVLQAIRDVLRVQLFSVADTPINIATLLVFGVIVVVTLFFSRFLQRGNRHFLQRRGVKDEGTIRATSRLIHYMVLFGGLGIGLNTMGINLTALFAAGAVFAVAVGFAMQNIAQNFVSGVILLLERTIKPGDVLEVNGTMVKVMEMSIRATVARTLDDEDLIIPNSILVQSTVKNYTLRDPQYRIRVPVGVVYGSDMERVERVLNETARSLTWRFAEKEPRILMTAFGSSSVDFEVSVWIEDPWNVRRAVSDLHTAIWWALKDANVTIAFPQVDVHLDPPVMDTLAAIGKRG